MRGRVWGLVPCLGAATASLGIFHPGLRGPERREHALSPAPHLARFRRSSRSRARSPPPGRAPPLSPWRRPASAATAALSSRGCRGGARKPHAWSCRRLPWTQVSVARSGAHPAWSGATPRVCGRRRRLLRAPGCLRKDPPRSCPPSASLLRCRIPSARGGAGQGGSSRLLAPRLDPGKAGLGDKDWMGRGREGFLNPSYFPPPHTPPPGH